MHASSLVLCGRRCLASLLDARAAREVNVFVHESEVALHATATFFVGGAIAGFFLRAFPQCIARVWIVDVAVLVKQVVATRNDLADGRRAADLVHHRARVVAVFATRCDVGDRAAGLPVVVRLVAVATARGVGSRSGVGELDKGAPVVLADGFAGVFVGDVIALLVPASTALVA